MRDYFQNIPVRSATILTTGYVTSNILDEDGTKRDLSSANQLSWFGYYTKGSLTSLNIYLEESLDGTNWVPTTVINYNGDPITLDNTGIFNTTDNGNFIISYPFSGRFARISVEGVGTVAGSTLAIGAYMQYV